MLPVVVGDGEAGKMGGPLGTRRQQQFSGKGASYY